MTDKDHRADWPQDEPLATDDERTQARALGDRLDRVLERAGDRPVDELSTTALSVQASVRELPLAPQRRDQLLDSALAEAAPQASRGQHSRGLRRLAPVLALAASVLLVVAGLMLTMHRQQAEQAEQTPVATVSSQTATGEGQPVDPRVMLSRPSNDLLGRPFADRAGASRRLDTVFADRLRGYRLVVLAQRQEQP